MPRQSSKPTKSIKPRDDDKSFYEDPGEELHKKGIYYISGGIDPGSLLDIQQDIILKQMNPEWKDDIQVIVNSYGGDVAECWALIDLLDWIRMDVRTIAMGYCASAGACIACCGTHGKRIISPNTTIMIHGAKTGAYGDVRQIMSVSKDLQDEHQKDIRFWLKHSKYKRKDKVEEVFLKGPDQFFTAEEALKHGIIDIIMNGDSGSLEKKDE